MRSTRRRKPRYEIDLRDHRQRLDQRQTRRGSATAAACGSSSARPAIAPPIASEPVSPMMMRAGCRVPPEEPRARTDERGRDDRQVERLGREHAVDLGMAELGERDDHERGERQRRRSGREPVEPVGEVHRVRGRVDDEDRPHDPAERRRSRSRAAASTTASSERCTQSIARTRRRARPATMPSVLPRLRSPRFRRARHAEVVVDEADDAEADDEDEQRPTRCSRTRRRRGGCARRDSRPRRADDREAAHRRRARLVHVRVLDRAVVADLLADARGAAATRMSNGVPRIVDEERRRRRP